MKILSVGSYIVNLELIKIIEVIQSADKIQLIVDSNVITVIDNNNHSTLGRDIKEVICHVMTAPYSNLHLNLSDLSEYNPHTTLWYLVSGDNRR